jgi:hypothetical protein
LIFAFFFSLQAKFDLQKYQSIQQDHLSAQDLLDFEEILNHYYWTWKDGHPVPFEELNELYLLFNPDTPRIELTIPFFQHHQSFLQGKKVLPNETYIFQGLIWFEKRGKNGSIFEVFESSDSKISLGIDEKKHQNQPAIALSSAKNPSFSFESDLKTNSGYLNDLFPGIWVSGWGPTYGHKIFFLEKKKFITQTPIQKTPTFGLSWQKDRSEILVSYQKTHVNQTLIQDKSQIDSIFLLSHSFEGSWRYYVFSNQKTFCSFSSFIGLSSWFHYFQKKYWISSSLYNLSFQINNWILVVPTLGVRLSQTYFKHFKIGIVFSGSWLKTQTLDHAALRNFIFIAGEIN